MSPRLLLTFFLACLGSFFALPALADPSIEEMYVRAVVTREGVLSVEESLFIFFDGQPLSEDVKRSISGRYASDRERTGFVLLHATMDERPGRFAVRRAPDHLELVLASKGEQFNMGRHHFKLRYELLNVISSTADSLDWLLVRESSAVIKEITVEAALPEEGAIFRRTEARMADLEEGVALLAPGQLRTTLPLRSGESFRVFLSWDHGLLADPGVTRATLRRTDVVMLIALALYSLFIAHRWGRRPRVKPAPPSLTPPGELSPALLRHLRGDAPDARGLAAEIFSLAVKGLIHIDDFTEATPSDAAGLRVAYSPLERMMKRRYRLRLTGDPDAESLSPTERILLHNLFASQDAQAREVVLDASALPRLRTTLRAMVRHLKELTAPFAFRLKSHWALGVLAFEAYTGFVMFKELSRGVGGVEPESGHALAFMAPLFLLAPFLGGEKIWKNSTPWFIVRTVIPLFFCACALTLLKEQGTDSLSLGALMGSLFILGVSWKTMPAYSEEGFHVRDQIQGFEMGLGSRATLKEQDTLERFEALFPYAYALDKEQSLIARYDPLISEARHHARWHTADTHSFSGGAEYFSLAYELGETLKNLLKTKGAPF